MGCPGKTKTLPRADPREQQLPWARNTVREGGDDAPEAGGVDGDACARAAGVGFGQEPGISAIAATRSADGCFCVGRRAGDSGAIDPDLQKRAGAIGIVSVEGDVLEPAAGVSATHPRPELVVTQAMVQSAIVPGVTSRPGHRYACAQVTAATGVEAL